MDRYAVLGCPVAHSLSPRIHAAFADATGQVLAYEPIEVAPGGLGAFLAGPVGRSLAGANVTLPHKEAALALAAAATARARHAGAANTLTRRDDGRWHADNTDGAGLLRDLEVNLGWPVAGLAILVLGAGGATRGILGPLLQAGPARVVVANRTPARAHALAGRFGIEAAGLDAVAGAFDAVVNATAAGHRGAEPALPAVRIAAHGWAYDLSYGAAARPFLAWAGRRGLARLADGLGMLVEQAALSFARWRGRTPPTTGVLEALRGE